MAPTKLNKKSLRKIIKERLPPNIRVASDVQDLLEECCVEFVNMLSSEAEEMSKQLITPKHVFQALETLGFEEYIGEVQATYHQHKIEESKKKGEKEAKKRAKEEEGGRMTEEEAIAAQQKLFAEARALLNNNNGVPTLAKKPRET